MNLNPRSAIRSASLFALVLVAGCDGAPKESKSDRSDTGHAPAAHAIVGLEAGQVRDDNSLKMKLVWCPPGPITMENIKIEYQNTGGETLPVPGQSPEIVPVKVVLTRGYWIGKYEITQSEWKQVMQSEPWKGQENTKEGADFPATFVSWNDAVDFCAKFSAREATAGRLPGGWEYRLPTEAQWERACRAGTETKFSFGDDQSKLGRYAWFRGNAAKIGERYAHQIGQKTANRWGIFDMHGNVYEWCRDTHTEDLPGGRDPEVNRNEEPDVTRRVHRGGGWGAPAGGCSSAQRYDHSPLARVDSLGFRVALSRSAER